MSWITIIWSGIAGACIAVAGFMLLMWAKSRHAWSYLLIGFAALAGVGLAALEMTLMRAQTPAQYGELMRAYHVPLFAVVVALVWFIRSYLGAGRLWLAWVITGARVLVLILTFSLEPNLNFNAITELRAISFLGETAVAPVTNEWYREYSPVHHLREDNRHSDCSAECDANNRCAPVTSGPPG